MSLKRIMDIEVLRGIAVLGVVLHHMRDNLFLGTASWLEALDPRAQFWWGVDLFFAISGFVIARSLIPTLQGCTTRQAFWQQARSFWIRRVFRLLPAAWLWLAVILLAALLFNRSGAFGSLHANVQATLAGLLHYANFRFADALLNYEYGASFVYWSLALEEQFYLLFPLLILLFRQRLAWALAVLVLAQLLIERGSLLMAVRTDALALGVLLAIWSAKPSYQRLEPTFLRRGWLGLALLVLASGVLGLLAAKRLLPEYRIGAIAVICGVLVWVASYNRDYLFPRGKLKDLLTWVGSRSYGIYLIHVPVYFFLREVCFRLQEAGGPNPYAYPWLLLGLALGLIVVLSELSYRLVELPMRNRGSRLVKRLESRRQGEENAAAIARQPMPE